MPEFPLKIARLFKLAFLREMQYSGITSNNLVSEITPRTMLLVRYCLESNGVTIFAKATSRLFSLGCRHPKLLVNYLMSTMFDFFLFQLEINGFTYMDKSLEDHVL